MRTLLVVDKIIDDADALFQNEFLLRDEVVATYIVGNKTLVQASEEQVVESNLGAIHQAARVETRY